MIRRVFFSVVLIMLVGAVVSSLPDVTRYFKMSSM
jgi:hypothetical protein